LVQVVPVQVGAKFPVRESAPQASSTLPFEWSVEVGTAWHSAQAMAADRSAVPVRCFWCAPTARVVVADSPRVPAGGAAFVALPWQDVQLIEAASTSTLPSTCTVAFAVAAV
jgi:hypothetical protein